MKRILIGSITLILLLFTSQQAHALLFDITDSSLPHFGDFTNQLPNLPNDYSNISKNIPSAGDFGWHNSPSSGSSLSGIIFSPSSHVVTKLRLQVHQNPFKDFILQGSTNTTNGFDGNWDQFRGHVPILRGLRIIPGTRTYFERLTIPGTRTYFERLANI